MKKINTMGVFAFSALSSFLLLNEENQVEATNQTMEVYLEGNKISFDQNPILIDGVTYIPVRNVAEATGASVLWDNQNQKVTIEDEFKKITFKIGATNGTLNNKEVAMPKSFITNDTYRTMVPLRFVSENLGLEVFWDSESGNIIQITSPSISEDKNESEKNYVRVVNELQENATKYIGTPYLFGASPMTIAYFDCSSFVQRLFAESGIYLPRVTSAQYQYGEDIPFSQLQPGDLLFFDTVGKGQISHVAIYINEDKLLHATTSKGVDYTTFNSYWKLRYLSAARVI